MPTFNSLAIETMLWRIEGLADRFLYFNDDMMLVGPVEPTDFFLNDGIVKLRGRWTNWQEQLEKGSSSTAAQAAGRGIAGLHAGPLLDRPRGLSLLRPAMEEMFDGFKSAFLANAAYRFRDRKQFWPISAHNHLLLKSDRARVIKSATRRFSRCATARRQARTILVRLKQLADGTKRMTCINYLEAVVDKVPDAMSYLSEATGPAAPFEKPHRGRYASRLRRRLFARLGSTLSEGLRDVFAKSGDRHDGNAASRSVR